jgi:Ca-activated chloride channel family protein
MEDGTAVGSAIVSSVARLRESGAKCKVIILLTDGISNSGKTDPLDAARVAEAYGIKIYTIGAGSEGEVPFPATDMWGRKVYQRAVIKIDEAMLRQVADVTGGKYFRATDAESLRAIYGDIDKLEKMKIDEHGFREYRELFGYFLIAALLVLTTETVLANTLFLRIP